MHCGGGGGGGGGDAAVVTPPPPPHRPVAGASRFVVVFCRCSGSRRQRSKREGALSVGYTVSYLYDTESKACVLRCAAAGAAPNKIFTALQRAHRGADWTVGTELHLCGFQVVIEEVMELHLIPYTEDVVSGAAAAAVDAGVPEVEDCAYEEAGTGAGGALAVHTASLRCPAVVRARDTSALHQRTLSSPPSSLHAAASAAPRSTCPSDPPLTPSAAYTAASIRAYDTGCLAAVASEVGPPREAAAAQPRTYLPPLTSGESSEASDCPTRRRERPRRRRRSTASLVRELQRCYPHHF